MRQTIWCSAQHKGSRGTSASSRMRIAGPSFIGAGGFAVPMGYEQPGTCNFSNTDVRPLGLFGGSTG